MRPLLVAVTAALYFNGDLLLNRVVSVESFQVPYSSTTTTGRCRHQLVATNYDDNRVGVVKRRRSQQLSTTWTRRPVVLLPTFHHQHQPKSSLLSLTSSSSSSYSNNNNNDSNSSIDPLITRASLTLRASSWVSWWSQLILTVVSTITFLFARNVLADTGGGGSAKVLGKFVLPGVGIALSSLSIIWTWGQRRLARQLVRQIGKNSNNNSNNKNNIINSSNNINNNNKKKNKTANNIIQSKVNVANLLRRTIHVGCILNILGLLASIAGAQVIVGTLAAKSMQVFVAGSNVVTSQTLQPLDVLIVQANTNILSSHFVSLVCLLYLTRIIDALDPPSLDDDDDIIDI
jgi:hypothetical protein